MDNITVVGHPLVQHKLTRLRSRTTAATEFRVLLREISTLLCYEVTRDLPLETLQIETPLAPMNSPVLGARAPVIAPILRAGLGLVDGMLELIPNAAVAHVGLYRDPESLAAIEYYFKTPPDLGERLVILVDPMLASGNTAVAAIDRLRAAGAGDIRCVCLLAAPEGIAQLHRHHPGVHLWTAAIDERLNDHGYIVPGLGDAGDRLYGT
jgi:uracil phosphoribosyltransferase